MTVDIRTAAQRAKPVYQWNVARAGVTGWLKHLWWIRDDHGRYLASSVCGRPKRKTLWPAFVPAGQTDADAARELAALPADETCSVCRQRSEGIIKRAASALMAGLAEGEDNGEHE